MDYYVGLDVSLRTVAVCVIDADGKPIFERSVACEIEDIVECLRDVPTAALRISFEAGPMSQNLFSGLRAFGFDVVCMEARQMNAALAATAGAVAATVMTPEQAKAQALARVDYPANRLANIADLVLNDPMDISYPDADSPGVLLKLGEAVEGGVGPDGDIVAFSVLCPHNGWLMSYSAEDKTLNCPGHHSRFDCEAGGQQIWGHATNNLAQFLLSVDDQGKIYANGIDELTYGRLSNVLV